MLSEADATTLIKRALPNRRIEPPIDYNNLYLFQAYDDSDPEEGGYDVYFSVNNQTGEVRDFSVITDGNLTDISKKFLAKQNGTK